MLVVHLSDFQGLFLAVGGGYVAVCAFRLAVRFLRG